MNKKVKRTSCYYFNLSDSELLSLYQNQKDEVAIEYLMYRYKDKLLQSIMFWNLAKQEAEDLAQDTFVKAIKSLNKSTYSEDGKFFGWLIRIARNLMIDNKRREKRYKEILKDKVTDKLYPELNNRELSADMSLQQKASSKTIAEMVEKLPENQKEIIKLRIYEQLSFKEIAELLDISLNTALGRMRYGVINLKKHFESLDVSEFYT